MTREMRPAPKKLFELEVVDEELIITSNKELSDSSWSAWFSVVQQTLREEKYENDSFKNIQLDFTLCEWADPLPIMSLAIALCEFEQKGGEIVVDFGSYSDSDEKKRFLKYMSREGLLDLLIKPNIEEILSKNVKRTKQHKRIVSFGGELVSDDIIVEIKGLNIPLIYERSTCLPAKILYLENPCNNDDDQILDDIDNWVAQKLYEAVSPVVTDMVPGWAQRSIRYRLLMTLRELLHNAAEHAHDDFGLAAVYVRYRMGALGESPKNWKQLRDFIKREETDQWHTPLLKPASISESFPSTRSGFFEVFVIDAGKGLCKTLGEDLIRDGGSPLQKCMLDIYDHGVGRRDERPTLYGGLYVLRQLLEPTHDYIRIRDEDAWWGTELPLKRTDDGSTPKGDITVSGRGLELTSTLLEGAAWTVRLSWLERTDIVNDNSPWVGLLDEKDKLYRKYLLYTLSRADAFNINEFPIFDFRFTFQRWNNVSELQNKKYKFNLFLPETDWMKNHIQNEIIKILENDLLHKNGILVIGDIPSEEAITYISAIEGSIVFKGNKFLKNLSKIILVTRDLKVCILSRDKNNFLKANKSLANNYVKREPKNFNEMDSLASYYSALRLHDSSRLWRIASLTDGTYINEEVEWSKAITLSGYLDFPQSLTHPVCRGIYSLSLHRLTGLFPRLNCILEPLDGLVDSLLVRFNAEQHPKESDVNPYTLYIGSVQVSGLTEELAGTIEKSTTFHFFGHPSGHRKEDNQKEIINNGFYLLAWLASTEDTKKIDSVNPYCRIGRTSVVARNGWKAYRMPRYDSEGRSIYGQSPKQSYQAWQEQSRTPLKIGHWSYGGHHDFLTLNLLLAFDTELDKINIAFGGSLAKFIYANLFKIFSIKVTDLTLKGVELFKAITKEGYDTLFDENKSPNNSLLLYPSHPVTDHVLDRFLSLISSEVVGGKQRSSLDIIRNKVLPVLPIRRHRTGSGLQLSGLILEKLDKMPNPKPAIVLFDDALISGRTYSDLKRLLRGIGFNELYSLAMIDRQRFPSADHIESKKHQCYWRLDVPSMGERHNCPLCHASHRVEDLSRELGSETYKKRIKSWRESWKPVNPATQWGDNGLHPIPINLERAHRKFSIEPDPKEPGTYCQIGGDSQQIQITNSAGLAVYITELHSITSHDDLGIRVLKNELLSYDVKIQLISSQLLLFSGEFDTSLAYELGKELLGALWEADIHDRHTSLAVLTLIGCGDSFLLEVVAKYFHENIPYQKQVVTRNLDLTLLLSFVLVIEKAKNNSSHQLDWLRNSNSVRGLINTRNKLELYGLLHRVVKDTAGKPHTPPLYRLKNAVSNHEDITPALLKEVLVSLSHLELIIANIEPYWLRNDEGNEIADIEIADIKLEVTRLQTEIENKIMLLLDGSLSKKKLSTILNDTKILATSILAEASIIYNKIFYPVGLTQMRTEGENSNSLFFELLENKFGVFRKEDKKKISWYQPSPYEIDVQLDNLNKPEMHEAFIVWDKSLESSIRDVFSNVRHAEGNISNPWIGKVNKNDEAYCWVRLDLEEAFIRIVICNKVHNPDKASNEFNKRISTSRAMLETSGVTLSSTPMEGNILKTDICIPYAHTLELK